MLLTGILVSYIQWRLIKNQVLPNVLHLRKFPRGGGLSNGIGQGNLRVCSIRRDKDNQQHEQINVPLLTNPTTLTSVVHANTLHM